MKESYWGYWLIVLGAFIVVVLLLVQSFTTTNTQDYYMVKTITEAAMEDAIDYSYFRTYGEAKINKEKFMESFIRRFAEEASLTTTYKIEFSDIYEAPPKVGVKVTSKAGGFSVTGSEKNIDIVNKIDAILESSSYRQDVVSSSGSETLPVDSSEYASKVTVTSGGVALRESLKGKTITYDFGTGGACEGKYKLTVDVCGTLNDDLRNLLFASKEEAKDIEFCILHAQDKTSCVVIPSKDQIEYMLSGRPSGPSGTSVSSVKYESFTIK